MIKRPIYALFASLIPFSSMLAAGTMPYQQEEGAEESSVRVVAVYPTPESEIVKIRLLYPRNGEMKNSSRPLVGLKLSGYALGVNSDFERNNEIWNDPNGQTLHVVIDEHNYFSINSVYIKTLDEREGFYDQELEFVVPFALSDGEHIIRIFPVRSYNESLKKENCFISSTFYVRSKAPTVDQNLKGPYLTYNEPTENYDAGQPILLDFYLTNCELSPDGYKVNLTIDGTIQRQITRWIPYYIYGLDKGKHTIRLQLIDNRNQVVPGVFNDVTKPIVIE